MDPNPKTSVVGGVGALLLAAAERAPDDLAVVSYEAPDAEPVRAIFRQLDEAARRAAARLAEAGVGPGDRVALIAANRIGFAAAWFAIAYRGATVVPIPILSAPGEIAFRLEHARCRAIVFDAERGDLVARASEGQSVHPLDLARLEASGDDDLAEPARVEAASPAMILYTSGTTGRPKGALISHRTLLEHAAGIGDHALRLGARDRVLGVLPLTHSYGFRMVLLASLRAGCPCILVPRFDARGSLEIAEREGVTWFPAVPTMFAAWGALPDGPRPSKLAWCLSAGSPLADEILHRAERRLGCEIRQGYGMTEATFSTIDAPGDERVVGSVGRAAHGVDVRIADESGRDAPPLATGEVLVRGRNMMTGYLDDPAATAEALRDGWMHTGDVGYLDEAGRLFVVDRLKDMIIRGGNNVYPSEVEAVLTEHPDVREAAVVGRPDDFYGEEIVALVVPRGARGIDLGALRGWAAERIAKNKVPREWAVLESLPLGPSRKVLKRELRERIADGSIALSRG
ncbi:MAG: long-chain fatty acid--CoA ligase [Deltaproteobacteria bacterium]|nr:long-chain fatty acid--CoA ligase [Deltaproteobacteria bacterium]